MGTGTETDPYIISEVSHLAYITEAGPDYTHGKFFKVADGISNIVLQKAADAETLINIKSAEEAKTYLSSLTGRSRWNTGKYDAASAFCGTFDGNDATIYGLSADTSINISLFGSVGCNAEFKNLNIKNSFIQTGWYAATLAHITVGYTLADGTAVSKGTVKVHDCTFAQNYINPQSGVNPGTTGNQCIAVILGQTGSSASGSGLSLKNILTYDNITFYEKTQTNISPLIGTLYSPPGPDAETATEYCDVMDCIFLDVTSHLMAAANNNLISYKNAQSVYSDSYWIQDWIDSGWYNAQGLDAKTVSKAEMLGTSALTAAPNLTWGNDWIVGAAGELPSRAGLRYVSDTIYWDGSNTKTAPTVGSGTKKDPYIISSIAELAYISGQLRDNYGITDGKFYKIADGIKNIVMQPYAYGAEIMTLKNAAEVKAYFEANSANLKQWIHYGWEGSTFCGNIDFNGATVYGIYQTSTDNAGLFSNIDAGAVISNLAIRNSYMKSESPNKNYQVGAIASVTNGDTYGKAVKGIIWLKNIVVANNYMYDNVVSTANNERAGVIIGASSDTIYVDNALVYGNDATYGDGAIMPIMSTASNSVPKDAPIPEGLVISTATAAIGDVHNNMVRNSIILGANPVDYSQGKGSRFNDPACFENVYTDVDIANKTFSDGKTVLGAKDNQIAHVSADAIKGTAAKDNMPGLTWGTDWFCGASDALPSLYIYTTFGVNETSTAAHKLYGSSVTYNDDGTFDFNLHFVPQYEGIKAVLYVGTKDGSKFYKLDATESSYRNDLGANALMFTLPNISARDLDKVWLPTIVVEGSAMLEWGQTTPIALVDNANGVLNGDYATADKAVSAALLNYGTTAKEALAITKNDYKAGTIDLLVFGQYLKDGGSTSTYYDTVVADNGETGDSWDNAIIIDSAEELVYLCKASGDETKGKYYKVADGIAGFDLSAGNLDLDGTLADNFAKIQAGGKNHAGGTNGFQGYFDGNNAVVYGAWTNHAVGNIPSYAGLFTQTKGGVIIKNIHVKFASFTATSVAGGIIGYSKADDMCTITIENCSVTDSHLEVTTSAWGNGVGAIVGRGGSAPSYKDDAGNTVYVNIIYNIKNCYVNLDEDYFITKDEGTSVAGQQVCHGGVVGVCDSNALNVQDCVVIGITPYATSISNNNNAVQHSGLETHFKNVYTTADVPITGVNIGGTLTNRNFTGRVFPLADEQLKGSAAINNMTLDWFGAWLPGAEGEYPKLAPKGYVSDLDFWDGTAATEYAGGTGTKEDPFIIKTAEQLYKAVSEITGTTEGVSSSESTQVAGGYQSDKIFKQGSTTEYVAVYTPYYYKVDDSIKSLYLNSVYGNETLEGAKAVAATGSKKDWKPGKSFVGHLDGNGVTIYGLYSSNGQGLIYKLDGAADVRNINFAAGYSAGTSNSAMLTTTLGSYTNDTTLINISNISVRECYISTTRGVSSSNAYNSDKDHYGTVSGVVSSYSTCENLTISNCFFDGYSCEMVMGANCVGTVADGYVSTYGGIISGGTGMNNTLVTGCVSLGAPVVDEVYDANVDYKYTRYDANQGFQVFFYDSYTDYPATLTTNRPGQYDKLLNFTRVEKKDAYEKADMPKLAWANWELVTVDGRTIPMPKAIASTAESVGSFIQLIGQGQNKYAGVGPYAYGANPYTWLLKGKGTEEDPYLIENAEQLARAIATGGMNLYDKLYYKLVADIDLSGGSWLTQDKRAEGGIYYVYTAFGGVLDGNGHTITGLSAGDNESAGLIPVLKSTGVVKNLHVRNSSAISLKYAGIIAGEIETGAQIIGCSVEDCEASGKLGTAIISGTKTGWENVYYIDGTTEYYLADQEYNAATCRNIFTLEANKANWYIGGKADSKPRLKSQGGTNGGALDIAGDGLADGYGANDLTALRNRFLRKADYANVNGDVSRNGVINIADLAVLQRTIVGEYGGNITDSFFANVQAGQIRIYYGENDNYDAARRLELYLENLYPGVDVVKCVSTDKGTVTGANSDSSKVYVHTGDAVESPDGTLDIIVGDVVGYTAGLSANQYEVTYDPANKVVWLKGENFTAVEQAVINFVNGSKVDGDVVYTCGVTELEDYKKPITVKLDTNFDGTIDTDKVLYYAWGDEFDGDTTDTHNWQHNTQQTEGMSGDSYSSYKDQEVAPVVELHKVLTIENGKLMMKRGYRKGTDGYTEDINGVVALDITDSYNGYNDLNGNPSIQDDDNYFCSGKVTTERGMLYKQGYIEFSGRVPADGHAFPAWWLMGRPSQSATNHGYDNSLYGKVYKINDKWNGSNNFDEDVLDTYKYQLPSAIYEIDMIEVMQHVDRHRTQAGESEWGFNLGSSRYNDDYLTYKKAINLYYLNTTIHKWWNNGVDNQNTADTSDDRLHIIDWDNYTVSSGITNSDFSTTSSADSWIHNPGSTQYDFGTQTQSKMGTPYYKTQDFYQTGHDALTLERRYGFSWYTNGTGFEATLYIYNADGTLLTTVPIASGDSDGVHAFMDNNKKTEANGIIGSVDGGAFKNIYSDAKVFNQYMYILFDNKYYSSNDNMSDDSVFTDLLTSLGLKTFEIDYVRVYQQDNQRDIVTQATQNFNNNNHFGY